MKVKFRKTDTNAFVPTKESKGAGAYDLYAPNDICIPEYSRHIIQTGIAMEIPQGFVADIRPRSGYSAKGFADNDGGRHNADVILGTIDSDYRGSIGVIIRNNDKAFIVGRGQRIAQLLIHKAEDIEFEEVEELSQTERGENGFNSTGI